MNLESLRSSLCESLHKQWEFTAAPRGSVRVRTPYMYPDGGILDLFVLELADGYKLTDFGETVAWLRMRTGSTKLSAKRRGQIHDLCLRHGVDVDRGQLELSGLGKNDLSRAMVRLAGVAARVSDLWFTFPSARVETERDAPDLRFQREVENWLGAREISFERRAKRSGSSGRDWWIDYETHTESRTALVFLMTSHSPREAHRLAEQVLAACVDLNPIAHSEQGILSLREYRDVVKVSLFDNTYGAWQESDLGLVAHASKVVSWSNPDEFERELYAA